MMEGKRLVVIGCSGCGALAGLTAKKLDPALDVTILREDCEPGLLTRCATPYICCGDALVNPSYKNDSLFTDAGIKLVNRRAMTIDRTGKTVTAEDGSVFAYDKLVLAPGARPVIPPIPGVDLAGVFTLRTSSDAAAILNWLNSRRVTSAVLVGAGAIGIEEAYLLSRQEVKVTIVEMFGQVMPRLLDPEMSLLVEAEMKQRGLQLRLNRKVIAIEGSGGVERVRLDSGEVLPADAVMMSAGVRCNTELAEAAGLERGERGLKVNEYLQTSDPDVYAGGDVIEYPSHVTGRPILGQLRPNAVIAGRVIAWNVLGAGSKYPPLINSLCTKFYDKCIAAAGLTESVALEMGMRVLAYTQDSTSMHSMMRGRKPYRVKLVFDADSAKLIGGQIVSDSAASVRSIDVIALAIRCGLTAADLATFRAAGQPELSPDPGQEPIALAAQSAFHRLRKRPAGS